MINEGHKIPPTFLNNRKIKIKVFFDIKASNYFFQGAPITLKSTFLSTEYRQTPYNYPLITSLLHELER